MDTFTRGDLHRLIDCHSTPCVSIYLPTVRVGEQELQNPILLKNLLGEAEEQLIARGQRPVAARELIDTARPLLTDVRFWQKPEDGLALFFSPQGLWRWRLPACFDRFVWVGKRFYVKPLFPLVTEDDGFYLLAVSQNRVRVFHGTRWEIAELQVDGLPKNLADALHYDQPEGLLQMRSGASGLPGKEGSVFYGQGGAVEHQKDDVAAYFREINRGLHDLLHDKRSPLIFAGVDYLFPIYRSVSRYPHLIETPIAGNPELSSKAELHSRAKALLMPLWKQAVARSAESFAEQEGAGRASGDLADILRAAHEGRVATLFAARHAQWWGTFDAVTGTTDAVPSTQPGSQDLVDMAATATFAHGGEVYVVDDRDVPGGGALAALYRYRVAPVTVDS